ncbi:response regulator transcription factor [Pseudomonas moorei]|nr:response regulator transcription factor [Pseudomonas moorei]
MSESIVYIVDDDQAICDAVSGLLRSVDLQVKSFPSPAEFLQYARPDVPSCLILDVRLKGASGLDFQSRMGELNLNIPVIVMTAHGDIAMSVRAMKAGARDFLTKPFRDQDLLDAVAEALVQDKEHRLREQGCSDMRSRYESLTRREQEVMAMATAGLLNKQIAGELELSEVTVKIYRGSAMKKMRAKSFADLVRIAEALSI